MPSLGSDMEEGTLLEWLVGPGDAVNRGQIVAVVDTDKAEIEIESFHSGVVEELLVSPGQTVPVGTALARLRDAGAAAAPLRARPLAPVPPAAPGPARPVAPAPTSRAPAWPARPPAPAGPPPPGPAAAAVAREAAVARVRVTPLARRVAAQLGVELAGIVGSGPQGEIVSADVERAAAGGAPAVAPPQRATPAPAAARDHRESLRRALAGAMARSKREIPHYYLGSHIDMTRALEWLARHNAQRSPAERVLPVALWLKAVGLAAREFPEMNGFWRNDRFEAAEEVHVAIAVSLRDGGLVAPVLRDVPQRPLDDLMRGLRDLVGRARRGVLRSSEVGPATLTVTPLGEQGAETVLGVIFPPQVCLVGFGAIVERPWAVDGMLTARRVVWASVAADHRVSSGHRGSLFLASIDRHLREPEAL
jgi:pyruvate dehydrogenase E2 component (dihydrolipoamide acetyltransferase)